MRPVKGQIDDLLHEIRSRAEKNERVLVTTLTKRMAEDLAEYYSEVGVRCRYMHSEIETLERIKILRDLRKGEFDVLIGINLLREGLDLPEVSLVAILDADKEGFLRSAGSLIQTMGRCARNLNGRAILYADNMTDSMKKAIDETYRRRAIQRAYNEEHGITPETIVRPLDMTLVAVANADYTDLTNEAEGLPEFRSQEELDAYIAKLESDMREAAKRFEFEQAAKLRDTIRELRTKEFMLRSRGLVCKQTTGGRLGPEELAIIRPELPYSLAHNHWEMIMTGCCRAHELMQLVILRRRRYVLVAMVSLTVWMIVVEEAPWLATYTLAGGWFGGNPNGAGAGGQRNCAKHGRTGGTDIRYIVRSPNLQRRTACHWVERSQTREWYRHSPSPAAGLPASQ